MKRPAARFYRWGQTAGRAAKKQGAEALQRPAPLPIHKRLLCNGERQFYTAWRFDLSPWQNNAPLDA